jgi:hypothetical protein
MTFARIVIATAISARSARATKAGRNVATPLSDGVVGRSLSYTYSFLWWKTPLARGKTNYILYYL